MRLIVTLALTILVLGVAVNGQGEPKIWNVDIAQLLKEKPDLKAEIEKEILAKKDTEPEAPKTTPAVTTTTTGTTAEPSSTTTAEPTTTTPSAENAKPPRISRHRLSLRQQQKQQQ